MAPGFPENAIETIERMLEAIPAIIEIDVVSSADGIDYLHHDEVLQRTTSGVGSSNSLSWNEIAELKMIDNNLVETDYRPIALDAALERLSGRGFLMLDLKAPSRTQSVIEKVSQVGMLDASVFIAYDFDQAREILSAAPTAFVALGASSLEQVEATKQAGFFDSSYVGLTGALGAQQEVTDMLLDAGHFVLAGTYLGPNPPDAKVAIANNVTLLDRAPETGVQLLVSNRPAQIFNYLSERGLAITEASCD